MSNDSKNTIEIIISLLEILSSTIIPQLKLPKTWKIILSIAVPTIINVLKKILTLYENE